MMQIKNYFLNNNNGSVLFFTLLILVMMAAAGFTMISNSVLESNIVRNTSSRTINFYAAESAAMEAAQRLKNLPDNSIKLKTLDEPWLNSNGAPYLAALSENWDFNGSAPDDAQGGHILNTAFTTVRVKLCAGDTLDIGSDSICFEYNALGRYYDANNNSVAMIGLGYQKDQKNY